MKYVCTGATLRCTMGTSCPKLRATPKNVSLTGKDQANIADYVSIKNIPSFGRCRSLGYPPTASATAANHGKLTPMPCVPGTCPKWQAIDKDSLICGEPALLEPATLRCMYGGTISIVNPGQSLEIKVRGVSFSQRSETQQEKAMQEIPEELLQEFNALDRERLSQQSVLDGVQMALDVAGMAPGVGAIPDLMNAAISALRGDWVGAGLSIIAAVPLIGDVVGGAKIAYRGAKTARVLQKTGVMQKISKAAKETDKYKRHAQLAQASKEFKYIDITPQKLKQLGISDSDSDFFMKKVRYYRRDEISKLYDGSDVDMFERESHLNCVDVSSPIIEKGIAQKGDRYYMFRKVNEHGTIIDAPGNYGIREIDSSNTTPGRVGIADGGKLETSEGKEIPFKREMYSVEITENTPYIVTKARKTTDSWSDRKNPVKVPGGGTQVFFVKKSNIK